MNVFLRYEWRPRAGGTEIAFEFNGNILDMTKAVGMLIQQAYGNACAEDRQFFKFACKQMMDDDCPVWHLERENVMTIDMKELRKQARGKTEQE